MPYLLKENFESANTLPGEKVAIDKAYRKWPAPFQMKRPSKILNCATYKQQKTAAWWNGGFEAHT
jgi:hypothetical protein